MCSPILHVGPCARNLKPPGRYFLPYVLILKAVNKQILNPKCWSCPSALHLKGPTGMIPSIIPMATGGGIIRRGCFSFQCCPVQQHMARRQERTGTAWRKRGKRKRPAAPTAPAASVPSLPTSSHKILDRIFYWFVKIWWKTLPLPHWRYSTSVLQCISISFIKCLFYC